jgi:hypothetical protein
MSKEAEDTKKEEEPKEDKQEKATDKLESETPKEDFSYEKTSKRLSSIEEKLGKMTEAFENFIESGGVVRETATDTTMPDEDGDSSVDSDLEKDWSKMDFSIK